MRSVCLLLSLLMAPLLFAESWTNTVGHGIDAELVGRKGDVLTMKKTDGSTFTIHFAALAKGSQTRVEELFPVGKPPTHDDVVQQRQKERIRQLKRREK